MIDTEALKRLIIDKATSGLLSSRCDGDDDIESLIEKLPPVSSKREKLLTQSFDYDEKFIIPEHWKWVRLGEISSYGDTPAKFAPDAICDDMWILELEDIESGGRLLAKIRYPSRKPAGEKTGFTKGQILYSKLRPYLKKVLIADEDGVSTPELISFDVFGGIDAKYISYCLINSYVDRVINRRSYGVKMPRVDAGFMVNLPIPLPSIAEQKRIVSIVETAFFEIDRIAFLQQQYESDCEILKGKIIDAGIRGKLTEQLPEDGNAEDLYVQIQKEKAKLIKEGKIKKEKPLPEIFDDEIPFEIPSNWKWVRWGNIVNVVSARRVHQADWRDEGIPFYRAREIAVLADTGVVNNDLYISEGLYNDFSESGVPQAGDLMVTGVGTLGKTYVVQENDRFYYKDASVLCFENYANVNSDFLKRVMESRLMRSQINSNSGGTTVDTLTMVRMNQYVLPLPPREEQKRISNTINELLSLITE